MWKSIIMPNLSLIIRLFPHRAIFSLHLNLIIILLLYRAIFRLHLSSLIRFLPHRAIFSLLSKKATFLLFNRFLGGSKEVNMTQLSHQFRWVLLLIQLSRLLFSQLYSQSLWSSKKLEQIQDHNFLKVLAKELNRSIMTRFQIISPRM